MNNLEKKVPNPFVQILKKTKEGKLERFSGLVVCGILRFVGFSGMWSLAISNVSGWVGEDPNGTLGDGGVAGPIMYRPWIRGA